MSQLSETLPARYRRGLVVGKFAPLHRGHERLLRHAEARCEELCIISYTRPEFPGCEPEKRAAWLAELFPRARTLVVTPAWLARHLPGTELPANDAPELTHRRFVARLCLEWFQTTVEAVFTSESYGDGFAAELTACFQAASPGAPPVVHELLDLPRAVVPVSGTAVREDVHALRAWLPEAVYASFVQRICMLGGESSGKTTLAQELAAHFATSWVAEYGRELWIRQNGLLVYGDMLKIGQKQVRREERAARQAHRWVFCDTSPLTTLWYSQAMFGCVDPALEVLARRPYPLYILCDPAIPFEQDGTRQDEAFRQRQHAWYQERLAGLGAPWVEVSGSVPQRIAMVAAALEQYAPG